MSIADKDLFSAQALDYSKFRPTYPRELFQWLAEQCPVRDAAWDCGTGNGQAAVVLGEFFTRVLATDPSEKQLAAADPQKNVVYSVGRDVASGLPSHAVDLTTVAQAYHWFEHEKFFAELERVGKPGSLLAVWSYGLVEITPELDAILRRFHDEILGPWWEKERAHVMTGYRDLPFPYERLATPDFQMQAGWSLGHLLGYLGTWSSLQTCLKKTGHNPLEQIRGDLEKAWGAVPLRAVRWKLTLLVGRLPVR